MKMNKIWVLIFGLVILAALFFIYASSQPGVRLSCEEKKIVGFDIISGFGLMNIVPPPTVCQVNISLMADNQLICKDIIKSYNKEVIFPCKKLKSYDNKNITINAQFYNPEGNTTIGKDTKILTFNKVILEM